MIFVWTNPGSVCCASRPPPLLRRVTPLNTVVASGWQRSVRSEPKGVAERAERLRRSPANIPSRVFYSHFFPGKFLLSFYTPPTHVVKPAILLRRRLEGMMATSSAMRLLVAKSSVRRE